MSRYMYLDFFKKKSRGNPNPKNDLDIDLDLGQPIKDVVKIYSINYWNRIMIIGDYNALIDSVKKIKRRRATHNCFNQLHDG